MSDKGSGRRDSGRGKSRRGRRGAKRGTTAASHSFAELTPSRAPVKGPEPPKERPVTGGFYSLLIGVVLLWSFGGGGNALVSGLSLLLPGVLILRRMPGKAVDPGMARCGGALCLVLLVAFLPPFFGPTPDWRLSAEQAVGIGLPPVLTVQPWASFEAWLMVSASVLWFFGAASLRVNRSGRRRVLFALCFATALPAALVVLGNLAGWQLPESAARGVFTLFPDPAAMAGLLVLGGILSFAMAIEGLRERRLFSLVGLPVSGLCLTALVLLLSPAGLSFYFMGLVLWLLFRIAGQRGLLVLQAALPAVALLLALAILANGSGAASLANALAEGPTGGSGPGQAASNAAAAAAFSASPIGGVGLANFPMLLPQFLEHGGLPEPSMATSSDFARLFAEAGLLGSMILWVLLTLFFWSARLGGGAGDRPHRSIALVCAWVFLLFCVVDSPAQSPGSLYFALLLGALALPEARRLRSGAVEGGGHPALPRRLAGFPRYAAAALLAGFAGLWLLAGISGLGLKSELRFARLLEKASAMQAQRLPDQAGEALEAAASLKPLFWKPHFLAGRLALEARSDLELAERCFEKARFAAPQAARLRLMEGYAWAETDSDRALAAWREALRMDEGRAEAWFRQLIRFGLEERHLLEPLLRLSEVEGAWRVAALEAVGEARFKSELDQELAEDPGLTGFSPDQRQRLIETWIEKDAVEPVAAFLEAYGETLPAPWRARFFLYQRQARFEEAVAGLRAALPRPSLSGAPLDRRNLARVERAFSVGAKDFETGARLLRFYYANGDIGRALAVVEALASGADRFYFIDYWRGELLYLKGDFIESWYAFEAMLERHELPSESLETTRLKGNE